ncbi:aminoglycoside phosphotransferase family protein [Streptomyces sp. NPDC051940]|uniref:phosphotransferase family protein n=1 Tax=Streptomyces sp. NPDC051940 TaxID=3155675 RepID=UPI0034314ADB
MDVTPLLRALAGHHGLPLSAVRPAPLQGVANRVWFVGEHLVLRVARDEPGAVADLRKELAVIPYATELGVRTPRLEGFGETGPVPYVLLRRAHGVVPELPESAAGDPRGEVYRQLGAELALLHRGRYAGPPVPYDDGGDPLRTVERLRAEAYLGAAEARWLSGWFARLAPYREGVEPVLVHGDACPTNLLADPASGDLSWLLDWGDAHLGDPAEDFAKLPLRAVPYALAGYLGEAAAGSVQREWAARVLWHQLHWALARIPTPPGRDGVHWSSPMAARLLEVLRFYAEGAPEAWRGVGA